MLDLTPYELAGQAVGLLALALCVAAFASKDDDRLMAILILGNVAFAAQFALFGAWTASGVTTVIILRLILARRMPKSWPAMTAILAITCAVAAVTWSGPLDSFPLAAGIIGTYAMFMLRGVHMRAIMAIVSLCWIVTNALIGSIGALAAEVFILATNLVTIARIYRAHKLLAQNG
jgi:hypothetical protein